VSSGSPAEGLPHALAIAEALESLLAATRSSRVTLRQKAGRSSHFPVTHEALAPGVESLRATPAPEFTDQPVVQALKLGRQVVHQNTTALSDDPELLQLLRRYGDVRAQIVTPILLEDELAAALSVHQLLRPRNWTRDEIEHCRGTARKIQKIIAEQEGRLGIS